MKLYLRRTVVRLEYLLSFYCSEDLIGWCWSGDQHRRSLRRRILKMKKNSSQKLLASASSLDSFFHSWVKASALLFISFQLKGIGIIYICKYKDCMGEYKAVEFFWCILNCRWQLTKWSLIRFGKSSIKYPTVQVSAWGGRKDDQRTSAGKQKFFGFIKTINCKLQTVNYSTVTLFAKLRGLSTS